MTFLSWLADAGAPAEAAFVSFDAAVDGAAGCGAPQPAINSAADAIVAKVQALPDFSIRRL
ncbi:MAG TPA: hypothetical protein VIR57_14510 [Chloroflexota bacterium]